MEVEFITCSSHCPKSLFKIKKIQSVLEQSYLDQQNQFYFYNIYQISNQNFIQPSCLHQNQLCVNIIQFNINGKSAANIKTNQDQAIQTYDSIKDEANSVIVITGASSGIGRELALQYATRGVKLLLGARSEEELKEVCALCEQLGSSAHYKITDVSKEEDCKQPYQVEFERQLIEEAVRLYNRIDILVLNAGVNAHSFFEEFKDLSVFKKIMDVNFYGYVYCTKYALPHIRKSSGQFVVMSSISGEIGLPYRVPYCSSKFAVTGFFEALRTELEDFNVAITIVCPPSVRTPMRDHDLLKKHSPKDESEDRISIQECVQMILDAADRRARKIFFPFKAYLSVYVRPIFPDFVDKRLKQRAKL